MALLGIFQKNVEALINHPSLLKCSYLTLASTLASMRTWRNMLTLYPCFQRFLDFGNKQANAPWKMIIPCMSNGPFNWQLIRINDKLNAATQSREEDPGFASK